MNIIHPLTAGPIPNLNTFCTVVSPFYLLTSHIVVGSAEMRKIVAFGDSLTQRGFETDKGGWLARLANAYVRRFDVVNRGYGGGSE